MPSKCRHSRSLKIAFCCNDDDEVTLPSRPKPITLRSFERRSSPTKVPTPRPHWQNSDSVSDLRLPAPVARMPISGHAECYEDPSLTGIGADDLLALHSLYSWEDDLNLSEAVLERRSEGVTPAAAHITDDNAGIDLDKPPSRGLAGEPKDADVDADSSNAEAVVPKTRDSSEIGSDVGIHCQAPRLIITEPPLDSDVKDSSPPDKTNPPAHESKCKLNNDDDKKEAEEGEGADAHDEPETLTQMWSRISNAVYHLGAV